MHRPLLAHSCFFRIFNPNGRIDRIQKTIWNESFARWALPRVLLAHQEPSLKPVGVCDERNNEIKNAPNQKIGEFES